MFDTAPEPPAPADTAADDDTVDGVDAAAVDEVLAALGSAFAELAELPITALGDDATLAAVS
jgi:hypothetical protein